MRQITLFSLLFLSQISFSKIINVPADQGTIQAGINTASAGDTVLVAPGTYYESISLSKKGLTLASKYITTGDENYITQTKIDGSNQTVFVVSAPADVSTSIVGLTIQNGEDGISATAHFQIRNSIIIDCSDGIDYESGGGGICRDNVFRDNHDDAIDLDYDNDILIEDNLLENNHDDGIEIRLQEYQGSTVYINIRRNVIHGSGEDGIQIIDYPDLSSRIITIERNLIYDNDMVGIGCMSDGNTTENYEGAPIPENIFVFNNTIDGHNYGITGGANLVAVNNIVTGCTTRGTKNVTGNSVIAYGLFHGNGSDTDNCNLDSSTILFNDPGFVNGYDLSDASPCRDAGTSLFVWQSDTVLNLSPDEYVGTNPDIGALEWKWPVSDRIPGREPDVRVYPNPSSGIFYVDLNQFTNTAQCEIFNSAGRKIHSLNLTDQITMINLSGYPAGFNILRISNDQILITRKISVYPE